VRRELTVAIVCGALVVGCSTSHGSARRKSATSSTRSVTTATGPTTSTTAPVIAYHVKRGDTLTAIANHFGVPVSVIILRNQIANPDRLTEGQTLLIPPAPPIQLLVTPAKGEPGQSFDLKLIGAKPSESITFEIDSPNGKYKGHPHTASTAGLVTATYQTAPTDRPGNYVVIATGTKSSTARAGFVVIPSPTGGT
jgi:LysM repeat protein